MANKPHGVLKSIVIGVVVAIVSAYVLLILGINDKGESIITPQLPKENVPSKGINVSGSYRGTAFNQTYSRRAKIRLVINQDMYGKVTGTINVAGSLSGSGLVEGFTNGFKIGLTSIDVSNGMVITFQGKFKDGVISGDYTVSLTSDQKATNPGLTDQEGFLKVSR
jgi:hypothetical protein